MKVDVLLGLQWGDEGKGKIVDKIASEYDVVARFQGGPNAGHTIETENFKHVLHIIPSGIFSKHILNIIGGGVIIDPVILRQEILAINKLGFDITENLVISKRAHFILPSHKLIDQANEMARGTNKIGSTLKGIGPTYMDKTGRNGIRVGDINCPTFNERYVNLVNKHKQILAQYDFTYDITKGEDEWFESIEFLKRYRQEETVYLINDCINNNKSVLAEGAQGTLLDIDFGTYPFVTSSNTICAGACTGLGVAPNKIGKVIGIFKAYCTRVGSGPFPSELTDETGVLLQKFGNEYGSTTGRPRRCGWLDLPALKYSVMINGVTELIMTKADVMNTFDKIKIVTGYEINDCTTELYPYELNCISKPILKEFDGWKQPIEDETEFKNLPINLLKYIKYIEEQVQVPIKMISIGPKRKQTISA